MVNLSLMWYRTPTGVEGGGDCGSNRYIVATNGNSAEHDGKEVLCNLFERYGQYKVLR